MNDYTFEQYDNARETRAWYERFLYEHNGSDWQRKMKFPIADLLTGNTPTGPNGEKTTISWYRIKYQGVLIGYADAKVHPIFNGRNVISDMWIIPRFRKQGHFHCSFPALVKYTNAVGICIIWPKYRLYGSWFESFGFEWLTAFGTDTSDDPDNAVLFLVTRDAYKDMVRFMIRHGGGYGHPCTERGKILFEEIQRELGHENT
jgi:hypothetical protein